MGKWKLWISIFKAIPVWLYFLVVNPLIPRYRKEVYQKDLDCWIKKFGIGKGSFSRCRLFVDYKEFRNLTYKRLGLVAYPLVLFYRGQNNLTIACNNIGPGMFIQHGYSTVICAEQIGRNFHVNQCVNIVWNGSKQPFIGDNVSVYAGAIVVGGVRIGNNVTIGAGAVVRSDVPDNSIVIGNPMQVILKSN